VQRSEDPIHVGIAGDDTPHEAELASEELRHSKLSHDRACAEEPNKTRSSEETIELDGRESTDNMPLSSRKQIDELLTLADDLGSRETSGFCKNRATLREERF
jgi:hypothetical protein